VRSSRPPSFRSPAGGPSAGPPPDTLGGVTRTLDVVAREAGRDPADIRRIYERLLGPIGRLAIEI